MRQGLLTAPKLHYVAFRRKALFVEGVSEIVKVAGIVYYPRHEDPSYSLSCPENRQDKNNNSEYRKKHRVGLQTSASRSTRETLKEKERRRRSGILGLIDFQLGVLVASGGAPLWSQTPASTITRGGGELEFRTDQLQSGRRFQIVVEISFVIKTWEPPPLW